MHDRQNGNNADLYSLNVSSLNSLRYTAPLNYKPPLQPLQQELEQLNLNQNTLISERSNGIT